MYSKQTARKKGKKVPIVIKGLGTFYISRKWLLISSGIAFLTFLSLLLFLWWLWTIRIPALTG